MGLFLGVFSFLLHLFRAYNQSLGDPGQPLKPRVELIDWDEMVKSAGDSDLEQRFAMLLKEANARFGLIRVCDNIRPPENKLQHSEFDDAFFDEDYDETDDRVDQSGGDTRGKFELDHNEEVNDDDIPWGNKIR